MQTQQIVNNVPVDQLMETMEAIRKEPKIAKFVFRAKNDWQDGGHCRATANEFHGALEDHARTAPYTFDMDEPPVLLGQDRGANPVEYLLAALSGCLTTSLVYHAAARGVELTKVESSYEGDIDARGFLGMDENVRNGYEQLRVTFKVEGNASDE
ncbi:MAG: OsmC family protein, partial [Planctomycetota bacterium]